jgi:hypothetical protein
MANLKRARDFVKYIELKENTPNELRFTNEEQYQKILKDYARSLGLNTKEVRSIVAIADNYIRSERVDETDTMKLVTNPYQAPDFLERTIFNLFPKGLFMAWLNKNFKPLTLIFTFLSGAVVTIVLFIVKWVVTGNP